jgi:hypothetical protein
LQKALTDALVIVIAGGVATVTVVSCVQPFASVTVIWKLPAQRLVILAIVEPPVHKYVYGVTPPEGITVACPLQTPLQVTGNAAAVISSALGCVMVTVAVTEQPVASVTVTVYGPAVKLVPVAALPPVGAHEYVYGAVPPATPTVALPLFPPKQLTFTELVIESLGPPATVTVTLAFAVQPLASVTVTL